MSVLNYVLINMRSILMSVVGFAALFVLLYKTSGLRYALLPSSAAISVVCLLRCFVLRIYISGYLGGLYQDENWYFYLFQSANILNTLLGILTIAVLFKGSLAKNLFITYIAEIILSIIWYIPMIILDSLLGMNYSASLLDYSNPFDLHILIVTALFIFLILRFGEPFLKRYRDWNPKHPVWLNILVTAYLLIGCLSNYRMAITRGKAGFAIVIMLMILLLSYFWYDYLYILHLQEMVRKEELISMGRSMKRQYADIMEQTAKIDHYRQEISTAINKIINRILEAKASKNIQKDERDIGDEKDFLVIASGYLETIRQQYNELTVYKYCDDIRMNELLLSCEAEMKAKGMETVFLFREYQTPRGISFADIEAVIRWMLKVVTSETSLERKRSEASSEEQALRERVVLHGGMVREMLVLSCEAEGTNILTPDFREIRKLIKRNKADYDVVKDDSQIQILIGIPTDK